MSESESQLTEADLTELRWMARVNPDGVGLYGPTVLRLGPLPACERLVELGLARRRDDAGERRGYWITTKGRAALADTPSTLEE